jgi:hypothetical protein
MLRQARLLQGRCGMLHQARLLQVIAFIATFGIDLVVFSESRFFLYCPFIHHLSSPVLSVPVHIGRETTISVKNEP